MQLKVNVEATLRNELFEALRADKRPLSGVGSEVLGEVEPFTKHLGTLRARVEPLSSGLHVAGWVSSGTPTASGLTRPLAGSTSTTSCR